MPPPTPNSEEPVKRRRAPVTGTPLSTGTRARLTTCQQHKPEPRPRGDCLPNARGLAAGSWAPQVASLTPRCVAGPYRGSMGSPAHTATQGVNVRILGPKHPPIGPITPPIRQALPPSTRARTRPTPPRAKARRPSQGRRAWSARGTHVAPQRTRSPQRAHPPPRAHPLYWIVTDTSCV